MQVLAPDRDGNRFTGRRKYLMLGAVSLTSLVASLVVMEGVLALAGWIYLRTRQGPSNHPWISGRIVKDSISVLALGDSFTFGGAGTGSKAFPAVLQRDLDRDYPGLLQVTNHGVCETTSKDVLKNLTAVTTFARPDLVLLLTGSADLFDPYPFADELLTASQRMDHFVKRRHVYKVLRHIWFEMSAMARAATDEPAFAKPPVHISAASGQAYRELEQLLEPRLGTAERRRRLTELSARPSLTGALSCGLLLLIDGNSEAAIEVFRRFKKTLRGLGDETGERELFHFVKDWFLVSDTRQEDELHERCGLLLLSIGPPETVRHCVEPLVRQYYYDSTLDPGKAVRAIDAAIADDPVLHTNRRLAAARITLQDMEAWRKNVAKWYRQNLKAILNGLEADGVQTVLQTYPISYEPINTIARELAKERDLALVDHKAVFEPLINQDRRKYILDDTHCTDAGHELMAQNVAQVLKERFLRHDHIVKALKDHCSSNDSIRGRIGRDDPPQDPDSPVH